MAFPVGSNGLSNGGSSPTQMSVQSSGQPNQGKHSQAEQIRIAVMGMTGSGKSTFIKKVTGREDIKVGHLLNSETSECEAYSFQTHGLSFTLIDTPGFDDSEFNEAAILSKLAIYMALKYRSGTLLNAILYLHPIHELRLEGSALNNLNMFKSLCGEDFYSNVVLATSFWSNVSEVEGAARLTQLEEHFWGDMVQKGARSVRLPDEPERCLALLLELAGAKNPQKSLLIQIQMEVEGRAVDDTDAAVSTRWLRERHAIIEQHRREVKLLEQERKIISQCQQEDAKELAKLAAEIDESEKRGDEEFARRMTALSLRDEEMEKRRIVREREERIKAQRKVEFFEDQERVERERISRRRQCNDIMEMISDLNLRGSRQAYLTQRFWDLGVPICDVCQHRCSVQLSYFCGDCGDYVICSRCYDAGRRCLSDDHIFLSRRSFMGTIAGKCQSMRNTTTDIYCDVCRMKVSELYFHCCRCKSDDFDMCKSCFVKGWHCEGRIHRLELLWL